MNNNQSAYKLTQNLIKLLPQQKLSRRCEFCKAPLFDFAREWTFKAYFEKFNFYFAKPINEILANLDIPHYNDGDNEYLKRHYKMEEIIKRIQCLTDFYQDYKEVRPNISITKAERIIQKRNDKQLKLFFQQQQENQEEDNDSEKEEIVINNMADQKKILPSNINYLDENLILSTMNWENSIKNKTKDNIVKQSIEVTQNDQIMSFETDQFDIYNPNASQGGISQKAETKNNQKLIEEFDNQNLAESQYIFQSILGDELIGSTSNLNKNDDNQFNKAAKPQKDNKPLAQFDYCKLQELINKLHSQKDEITTNESTRGNIKKVIESIISFNTSKQLKQSQLESKEKVLPKKKKKSKPFQKINLKHYKERKGSTQQNQNKVFIPQEVTQNFNFKNCQMINIQKNNHNNSSFKPKQQDSTNKVSNIILQQAAPKCNYNLISNLVQLNEGQINKKIPQEQSTHLRQNYDQAQVFKQSTALKTKQQLQNKSKLQQNDLQKLKASQKSNDYYILNCCQLQNDKLQHLKQYISQSILNNQSTKYLNMGAQTERQHENRLSQLSQQNQQQSLKQQQKQVSEYKQIQKHSFNNQEIHKNNLSEKFKIKLNLEKLKDNQQQIDTTQKESQRTQRTSKDCKLAHNSGQKGFWTSRQNVQQVDIQQLKKNLPTKQLTAPKPSKNKKNISQKPMVFQTHNELILQLQKQDCAGQSKCLTHRQQKTSSNQKEKNSNHFKNVSTSQQQHLIRPPNSARYPTSSQNVGQLEAKQFQVEKLKKFQVQII